MAQATQPYKRSLSGSIGSGMKSIMGGNDRRYYVLEHKVSSLYHKAGESQRIIVDQIELGRDPKCQVRFDESFETVSRRHAAIVKDGDNWKLVQLSQTNSTYLNGKPVKKEWYLQSGDEIQLSTNGPKLGFIIPQGDKGLVRSIGLSARMNLFRQQALRPYRTAITALSCVFLLAVGAGIWALTKQKDVIESQGQTIALQEQNIEQLNQDLADFHQQSAADQAAKDSLIASLQHNNDLLAADNERRKRELQHLSRRLRDVENRPVQPANVTGVVDNQAIEACLPGVYFIQSASFELTLPNGESGQVTCGEDGVPSWTGSGFLLNNGKFVTARHVVEPWYFWQDGEGSNQDMAMLNAVANNGGKVVAHLIAVSSSGNRINLTSRQFTIDRSHDRAGSTEDGSRLTLASIDNTDYAYANIGSSSGGLEFDAQKSTNMDRGEQLTVLGFPFGLGVDASGVNPVYGSAIVASPGLQDGIILTTDTNYEHGNSGGPVFYTNPSTGKLVVIGIVSAGAGRNIGCVVPISKVR